MHQIKTSGQPNNYGPSKPNGPTRTAKSGQPDRQPARRIYQCAATNQAETHNNTAFINATTATTWDNHQSSDTPNVRNSSRGQPSWEAGRTCMTNSVDGRTHPDRHRSRDRGGHPMHQE